MNYRLKGIEPLLRAVRRLPEKQVRQRGFRLLVVGSPDTRHYARTARRLGIEDRVRFLGFCPETRNAPTVRGRSIGGSAGWMDPR